MKEKRTKILACDDEISTLEVLKTISSEHYGVITAERGQEAIELFKKEFPDLIILDGSQNNRYKRAFNACG